MSLERLQRIVLTDPSQESVLRLILTARRLGRLGNILLPNPEILVRDQESKFLPEEIIRGYAEASAENIYLDNNLSLKDVAELLAYPYTFDTAELDLRLEAELGELIAIRQNAVRNEYVAYYATNSYSTMGDRLNPNRPVQIYRGLFKVNDNSVDLLSPLQEAFRETREADSELFYAINTGESDFNRRMQKTISAFDFLLSSFLYQFRDGYYINIHQMDRDDFQRMQKWEDALFDVSSYGAQVNYRNLFHITLEEMFI